ncbi:MAG: O-antigen ligase family protein [Caldilineaceae bacterium]|nr:O-antigen ligase family protein [Caldilineaceae bacterium]
MLNPQSAICPGQSRQLPKRLMNPNNKLDAWCNAALEAGWLAALVVAPMFFNVFSSRVFEPDKISLVRSIALFMLLVWLVKVANSGQLWLPAYGSNGLSADAPHPPDSTPLWQRILRTPFFVPLVLLAIAYTLSTFFSVARFVSWWGSYQRLQGTYTYLSYVIIALLTAGHLRTPDQIRRLQHTFILVSLPIAIYGVIQHYDKDPLPWGGDVTTRVAANAGNAIFLAAYLLMAVFFTMERIYSSFAHLLGAYSEQTGEDAEQSNVQDMPAAFAGGAYMFVLMVQLLAIFWTQSRGPILGILLGIYLMGLLLFSSLRPRGYRVLTMSWVGLGLGGVIFLILLNTTAVGNAVRTIPSLSRLSTILDLESGTAIVRVLIWDGASRMVAPHAPIIYPDGSEDAVNAIRPLVGYGPEAMWVAYNPFYPPDLAHYERRNASPDRSHNETWDSLVITGILGFIAYMSLFISVFYWALRWLGLISQRRDTILFGAILAIFSVALVLIFRDLDNGNWRFLGVAVPAGMMLGLGVYVTLAVFLHPELKPEPSQIPRQLLIIALVCTAAAHFVEIHFGIAIAATRTYFWVQTALLLVLGMHWAQPSPFAAVATGEADEALPAEEPPSAASRRRGRNNRRDRQVGRRRLLHGAPALPAFVMVDLLIFFTFVFIYTTNSQGLSSPFAILWNSITKRMVTGELVNSPSLLFLMLFTWLIGATLGLAQTSLSREQAPDIGWWLRGYGLHALVVWGGWLIYGMIQASRLIPLSGADLTAQLENVAGHFAVYTWLVVVWILAAAVVFAWPYLRERIAFGGSRALVGGLAALILTPIIFWFITTVNIALVRADIIYKQGQQFDSQSNWVSSIELYRRALQARTTEDHYMLFLGRALLEQAKQVTEGGAFSLGANPTLHDVLELTPNQVSQMNREELLRAAEVVLKEAQRVNPLNTDHTANLARLYRTWADLTDDPTERQTRLDESLAAYAMAVTLSPNAAHLWNERGNAYIAANMQDKAEEAYLKSLELDDLFAQTYLLLADLYDRNQEYDKMIAMLRKGIDTMNAHPRLKPTAQMYNYLTVALSRTGDTEGAIENALKVLELQPGDLGAMRNLMLLYRDADQPEKAIDMGQQILALAGTDNPQLVLQIRQLLVELYTATGQADQATLQYEEMRQLNPTDVNLLRTLQAQYQKEGNAAKEMEVLQTLVAQDPNSFEYPLELARLLQQQGQNEQAASYAQRALELAPEDQKAAINELLAQLKQ